MQYVKFDGGLATAQKREGRHTLKNNERYKRVFFI